MSPLALFLHNYRAPSLFRLVFLFRLVVFVFLFGLKKKSNTLFCLLTQNDICDCASASSNFNGIFHTSNSFPSYANVKNVLRNAANIGMSNHVKLIMIEYLPLNNSFTFIVFFYYSFYFCFYLFETVRCAVAKYQSATKCFRNKADEANSILQVYST